jgi:hypothetical protein
MRRVTPARVLVILLLGAVLGMILAWRVDAWILAPLGP